MSKAKKSKAASVANKTLYSRVSYLYQAAAFLASQERTDSTSTISSPDKPSGTSLSSSRRLLSDLQAVSLKGQIRLSPTMKRSICKRCDTLLLDESTCSTEVENKSKGGKKHWADMLVRTCKNCNLQQRTPVGAERQKRRPHRSLDKPVLQTQSKQEGMP